MKINKTGSTNYNYYVNCNLPNSGLVFAYFRYDLYPVDADNR